MHQRTHGFAPLYPLHRLGFTSHARLPFFTHLVNERLDPFPPRTLASFLAWRWLRRVGQTYDGRVGCTGDDGPE